MIELPRAAWRRSARCVSDHHCVEVADLGNEVGLRNSQRPEFSLTFSKKEWHSFVDGLRVGDFHPGKD